MKILQLVVAALLGGYLVQGGPVAAQRAVATYSKEAMSSLAELLDKAAKNGFHMEPSNATIFGGWLPRGRAQGNERWIPMLVVRDLDPEKTYRVIAAGDNDTKDLDVRIVDPTGKVVAVDDATARDAEVTFRPTRRQDYTIEMRLYDSTDNCVCIGAVMRK
jgi:hypothetical protein